MSTSTQGAAGSSGLAAVQEGLCNCDEGVQKLHGETVSCVTDPCSTHTAGSGRTPLLNTLEIITSYVTMT